MSKHALANPMMCKVWRGTCSGSPTRDVVPSGPDGMRGKVARLGVSLGPWAAYQYRCNLRKEYSDG